jgi:ATP-dependent helicase/nuclease subunit A
MDHILEDSGYLALAATTPGGASAGDVLHAVDRIRQVVEEGGSLADAADSLEDDSDAINEVESLPLEPGRTDVVRLMNLHKAKGLEAAVVFLADPSGGVKPRVDVHIERTDLKARGWFKIVRKTEGSHAKPQLAEHLDWPAYEAAELPYLQAEEDRLLYVAATRAREMLVISRWTSKGKSKAWGVLNDFLVSVKELSVPRKGATSQVQPLNCSVEEQAAASASRAVANEAVRNPSWSISSVTAEAQHIARMTRTADAERDDATKAVGTDTPAHRADAGMAWGTLIHGLLEHAMRYPVVTRTGIQMVPQNHLSLGPPHRTASGAAVRSAGAVTPARQRTLSRLA